MNDNTTVDNLRTIICPKCGKKIHYSLGHLLMEIDIKCFECGYITNIIDNSVLRNKLAIMLER